jgi:hypothetical protein
VCTVRVHYEQIVYGPACHLAAPTSGTAWRQGLTIVHFSAEPKPFLVTPPRVPLSNRLGENHAPNVSNKMCLR